MSESDVLKESALFQVRQWTLVPTLRALREPVLHGLCPDELERMIALGGLDLAAGALVAAYATDRPRRRRAAEALCGGATLALLSPHGSAEPEALRHLEHARRGLATKGMAWGGLAQLAAAATDPKRSRAERAAAGAALAASHLALGDPPEESARAAMLALSEAFELEHAPAALCVALAHLERTLADREISAAELAALVRA